jgi:hypothetical protein
VETQGSRIATRLNCTSFKVNGRQPYDPTGNRS